MTILRVNTARRVAPRSRSEYHPGNLTAFSPFRQDDAPALSGCDVDLRSEPLLYDAAGRPMYRAAGFERKS